MSKTSEESSAKTIGTIYWKRFEGWATSLKYKYWGDPFFRSKLFIICLQVSFVVFLLFLVSFYFDYLYESVSTTIVQGIMQSISQGLSISGEEIVGSTEIVKDYYFYGFLSIAVITTFAFGYVVSKLSLAPARNVLNSQKRFISDIAHELRTPLSIIKTNTEVFLLDKDPDGEAVRLLKSNLEELDRASEIINNLLSFNNLLQPQQMNFRSIDVGKIVEQAVDKLEESIANKKLIMTVKKIQPNTVWGNSTGIEQIIVNLLKNSITYTPNGGSISLSVEPDYKGNITIIIKDSGIGITEEDLKHIFEPFYRAERSRNRQFGSSGLGLTIVSELVKLHSGKISIQSVVNRGTTAIVSLPYSNEKKQSQDQKDQNEVSIDFSI